MRKRLVDYWVNLKIARLFLMFGCLKIDKSWQMMSSRVSLWLATMSQLSHHCPFLTLLLLLSVTKLDG